MTEDAATLGVTLTNLDEPLFDAAGATKRDLINYLDSVADRIIPELEDRPLSVIRVHRGRRPSCRRTSPRTRLPGCAGDDVGGVVEAGCELCASATTAGRCCGSRTSAPSSITPRWYASRSRSHDASGARHRPATTPTPFATRCKPRALVRQALIDEGLDAVIKTSGAKGLHIFVPIDSSVSIDAAAAATRAIAARAEQLDPEIAHHRVREG